MTWTSRAPVVAAALDQGVRDGLTAGAYVYAGAVKQALAGGYTSGDFVTGHVMRSVTVVPAVRTGDTYEAIVGTDVLYALFWEVGHHNLFTRRFERVEVWRPTLLAEAGRIQERAQAVATSRVLAMAAP
jgi:hypothetical protein